MNNKANSPDVGSLESFETAHSGLGAPGGENHGRAASEADKVAAITKLIAAIEADEDLRVGRGGPPPPIGAPVATSRSPPSPPLTAAVAESQCPGASEPGARPVPTSLPQLQWTPGVPDHVTRTDEAASFPNAANESAGQHTEAAHRNVRQQSSDARSRPPGAEGGTTVRTTPALVEVQEHIEKESLKRAADERVGDARSDVRRSPIEQTAGTPPMGGYGPPQPSKPEGGFSGETRDATEGARDGSRHGATPQCRREEEVNGERVPPAVDPSHSAPNKGGGKEATAIAPDRERSRKSAWCSCKTATVAAFAFALTLALLTVFVAVLEYVSHRDRPVVKGRFGAVRGQRLVVSDQGQDRTVLAFLGVPFAKGPRGPLRYKPPQPLDWSLGEDEGVVPLETNEKRPPCPQQDFYLGRQYVSTSNASEDCLHLNIWAPPWNCSTGTEMGGCSKRAVLFFLYGAAFQNGGNSFELYDGRYLSAFGDLVVVVPNYRVGALGFLSGPWENRLPGNAGLHDQRLALEWTLANIGPFGGDTSLVVLAGHDAGAASLGYHLFHGDRAFWTRNSTRFILQSGGPYHRYKGEGIEGARRLAESLRCPSDLSSDDAVTCLQRADVNAVARNPLALSFAPVFSRAPLSMPEARNAQGRSLANKGHIEGMEFLLGRAASEGVYPWFVAQHRSATSDARRLAVRLLGEDVLERWQTATGFVLDAESPAAVYWDAVGDVLEACPMSELAEQLQAWQNRVYVYVLGYRPSYTSWKDANETVHFEDVELIFGTPLRPGVSSSQKDREWSRTMIDIWATFARTGRAPQVRDVKWSLYDSARPTLMKLGPKDAVGEQSDDKQQQCVMMRSDRGAPRQPTTTAPRYDDAGTTAAQPLGGATRTSPTTLRDCGVAVVALACAYAVQLRA
ncbi:acetylcholinesterase-like [Dermacentor variabilis]|uniref:acetylcholinesterase-like n=1 Tax=Dermacentor variabilis TaxID=34621 RepID=UPI003F5BAAAD